MWSEERLRSGKQHVTFEFPKLPGIYYQSNKGMIGSFWRNISFVVIF